MNSDVPSSEKVLQQAVDESPGAALPNSYYQLLLQKCRSRRSTSDSVGKADIARQARKIYPPPGGK
jgi:hypothetical protein